MKVFSRLIATLGLILVSVFSLPLLSGASEVSFAANQSEHYDQVRSVLGDIAERSQTCTSSDSGFAGVETSLATQSFTLYWHGELPAPVASQLATLPADISISVLNAANTWCEMQETIQIVLASDLAGDVVSLVPEVDGSGVSISSNSEGQTFSLSDLVTSLSELPGVQVPLLEGDANTTSITMSTRQSDVSPWTGGSGFWISNSYCSAAIGVYSNANNAPYLLTASHCVEGAGLGVIYPIRTGDNLSSVGYIDATNTGFYKPPNDVAVIRPNSNSVATKSMYHGGYLASSVLVVKSARSSMVGDAICTNGANSGKHCGIYVTKVGVSQQFGGYVRSNLVVGNAVVSGTPIMAQGDSGGPIFSSDSSSNYYFNGTITGSTRSVACPTGFFYTPPGPKCTDEVYFSDSVSELSAIHMHL